MLLCQGLEMQRTGDLFLPHLREKDKGAMLMVEVGKPCGRGLQGDV